jgi:uncharacterized protein (TIGR02466 family)
MVDKMKLEMLFPTPVGIIDHDNFLIEEHNELINSDYQTRLDGGELSADTFILNNHAPLLKTWLLSCIQKYAIEAMAISDQLAITQSWCIKHTNHPQTLFSHMHPNSIISGAYYLDAPEGSAPLKIHKPNHSGGSVVNWDQPEHVTYNKPWTWSWMKFKAQTGRLILFPSHMYHSVEGNNTGLGRCVLSFNTWFTGPIGKSEQLYRLDTNLS